MVEKITDQQDFAVADAPSYLKKLDLGCGKNKKEGFLGVDQSPDVDADFIHDLNSYPYPFDDNSVFEIFTSHFIEHVGNIKAFMEECWRMLVPLGTMTIIAPYYSSVRAFQDYTHVRPISEMTFLYFNKEWMDENKLSHYGVKCNFEILNARYYYAPDWEARSDAAREWARIHYINSVQDIEVRVRAIK
jgi:predicted SAM-dependent methyltransferase